MSMLTVKEVNGMVFDYGFSLRGKSHIANGSCCQDNHKIKKLENGWYIAAIADGVGSAKNSQIGSKIATETVVEVCEEFMPWDYNVISIKSMMRTAYNYALKKIMREAEKTGNPIESYDTTLSMVIYDGHKVIYGHSGDGAIIGLNSFGDFVEITKPQKGVDGVTVIPLRAGYTQWKIDSYDEELASVLLVTDGMLDILCQYLLKDSQHRIYTPLASFFADPIGFGKGEKQDDRLRHILENFITASDDYKSEEFYIRLLEIYKKRILKGYDKVIEKIKEKNYPIGLMQNVQDDKTIVALINTDVMVENREKDFYSEPNWEQLQEAWNRKAYPHLYKDDSKEEQSNPETVVAKKTEKDVDVKDEFVPFAKVYESKKTKMAMAAYGKTTTSSLSRSKIISTETEKKGSEIEVSQSKMEVHDKPKKKGIIAKIGDAFD